MKKIEKKTEKITQKLNDFFLIEGFQFSDYLMVIIHAIVMIIGTIGFFYLWELLVFW